MKPWLAHYDADVPQSLTYPDKTLVDYLAELGRDHGAKPALLFKGTSVSYGDLESQSNAFGAALVALGVRPGDRVAVLLPNCPQFFIAEFGAWKAGAIVVPLNPIYSEREYIQTTKQPNIAKCATTQVVHYNSGSSIITRTSCEHRHAAANR